MKKVLFLFLFSVCVFVGAKGQVVECTSCGNIYSLAKKEPGSNGKTVTTVTFKNNIARAVTINIYYELNDGRWASALNYGPVSLEIGEMNSVTFDGTGRYVLFYCDHSNGTVRCDYPTPEQVRMKYGNRQQLPWLFCVAEVTNGKALGTVFVSQGFRSGEDQGRILSAYKTHIKNVLKDNTIPGIPLDANNMKFWIECRSRGYSKPIGNGVHLGMDYPQIIDYSASCCTSEDAINKSREGFIKFKNNFGNVDVVYMVDFDYNKVKQ